MKIGDQKKLYLSNRKVLGLSHQIILSQNQSCLLKTLRECE